MSNYADDLKGNVIKIGADETFETASTIKTYILACLFDKVKKGEVTLDDMITYKPEHFVDSVPFDSMEISYVYGEEESKTQRRRHVLEDV